MSGFFYDPHGLRQKEAMRECVESGEVDYFDALRYLFAVAEGRELTERERETRRKLREYCARAAPRTIN